MYFENFVMAAHGFWFCTLFGGHFCWLSLINTLASALWYFLWRFFLSLDFLRASPPGGFLLGMLCLLVGPACSTAC